SARPDRQGDRRDQRQPIRRSPSVARQSRDDARRAAADDAGYDEESPDEPRARGKAREPSPRAVRRLREQITNGEIRITNQIRSPNDEGFAPRHSGFVI